MPMRDGVNVTDAAGVPDAERERQATGTLGQSVPGTNGWAVASLVGGILGICCFPVLGSILAVVFGYVALGEIRLSGTRQVGRRMALVGVLLGWVGIACAVVLLLGVIVARAAVVRSAG